VIYTDGVHIVSDSSIQELHEFADKTGINRRWFHPSIRHPHYDVLSGTVLDKVVKNGAVMVSSRELVKKIRSAKEKS
jgi:hypothetical protein